MRLGQKFVPVVVFAVLLGGIGLAQWTGVWATTSQKNPARYTSGAYAGQYNPADIRGSYPFSEISDLFHVPIKDLAAAFQVEESKAADFKCKELETIFSEAPNEIRTGSVRMFVALYLGLPYELTEDTYLPDTAVQIIKEKSKLSQEKLEYLESHTVPIS